MPTSDPPDGQLLAAVAAGDRRALEQLYRRHAPWLTARLQRRCSDAGVVDEVLHLVASRDRRAPQALDMTAVELDRRLPGSWAVPLTLGVQKGRRIVLHPPAPVGLVLAILPMVVIGDNGPRDAFDVLSAGPSAYYGVLVYFAAWSVAARDRRSHTRELLPATPVSAPSRVAGLCVGALAPAVVCAVVVLSTHATQSLGGLYVVAPGPGHLAQPVATVLGGALLGIMVARLTRVPGAPVLAMIAVDVWLSNLDDGALLGTFMTWTVYSPDPGWTGLWPGSAGWHALYLLCLCAMAASGAFLRDAANRWRVLAVGAACTAAAIVSGLQQLP